MKKSTFLVNIISLVTGYILLILLVYSCVDIEPEPEPPKQLRFSTQAEIDNIEFNFPDCKILNWDVWIQGDDIANLHGFSQVTQITGGLHISTGDYLVNLEGLEGLTSIGGGLYIGTNTIHPVFNSLKGLDNLTSIGTELEIGGNTKLKDLKELGNLTSVGKAIVISGNEALKDLSGLESITFIKAGFIGIQGNDSLTSLTGLQINNADSIRLVQIIGNPLLSTCDVQCICSYLASPTGPVNIYDNAPGCASREEIETACGSGMH
ncbi:MAG: hypothetical protein M0Q51_11745 [Bacteroidales bacterium]|nr:hypothetical protein [Bacteroidales bacterium]